jgi:phage FluMu protein Com
MTRNPNSRWMIGVVLLGVVVPVWASDLTGDFRGGNFNGKMFRYEGPSPEKFIKTTKEGLEWKFGPDNRPSKPVGIYFLRQASGDFEVIAHYVIVKSDATENGRGPGAELYLSFNNPYQEAIALSRQSSSGTPKSLSSDNKKIDEKLPVDGKEPAKLPSGSFPIFRLLHLQTNLSGERKSNLKAAIVDTTAGNEGRFRLARSGSTVIASIANGEHGEFREIHRWEVGTSDVRMIRFAGLPGSNPKAVFNMRLLHFQLNGSVLGPQSKAVEPAYLSAKANENTDGSAPNSSSRWIWLLSVGMLILFLGILGLVIRRRRRQVRTIDTPTPSETKSEDEKPYSNSVLPTTGKSFSFRCSSCGKILRGKAEVAGKRVKCPACGQLVTAEVNAEVSPHNAMP